MRLKHKIIVLPCVSVGLLMAMVAIMLIRQYAQSQQGMTVTLVLNRLLWQTTLMGGVILIITLFLAWGLAHKHLTPIVKITVIAREIAGGDLSSAANAMKTLAKHESIELQSASDDETGQLLLAFETMTENLNSLVGQVQRSGVQVSSSSSELFASARQQEAMVTNQMESMTKVRTSVEEISTIAADLVQTIHRVAAISQETADFASSGQTDLVRLKDAMYRMEKASKAISDKLGAINEKADNITAVITTIAKVADQTNLLSLNAAIEAEKAGEYGHGFTVVSREIRRLADQTAIATVDVEQMVREMQAAVAAGVMAMDKFIAEVRTSVDDVSRISAQLTKIIAQVQTLSPNFENVNAAVEQQSQNTYQITSAMTYLTEDVAQTQRALRESYAAIKYLNDAAQDLENEVSRFQVSFSILNEIEIFDPFSPQAKSYLNQRMQGHHYAPGETIIRQGDLSDSLFIIAKGTIGIWVRLQDGRVLEVARRAAVDIVGEMALLTGAPRTANVIAMTDVHAFEVAKKTIMPLIEKEPEIAERLREILTERKQDTAAKTARYETQIPISAPWYKRFLQIFGQLWE